MDHNDGSTKAGTIGGTLLVALLNVFDNDILHTIGFAALGATVSFFVSLFWKAIVRKLSRQRKWPEEEVRGGDSHQQ